MKFIMFTKHLEHLSYEELADTIAGIGLDGVDLTVRSPGHVMPENVRTDLPKAAKAIRDRGLEVGWITTEHLQRRRALRRGHPGDRQRPGHHAIQAWLSQIRWLRQSQAPACRDT